MEEDNALLEATSDIAAITRIAAWHAYLLYRASIRYGVEKCYDVLVELHTLSGHSIVDMIGVIEALSKLKCRSRFVQELYNMEEQYHEQA